MLAYVAGHTHENNVQPFTRSGGGVWWGIETSATADWPVQHRLVELMDNRDGTLSIFGTVLDAASSATAPAPGSAVAFDEAMLASLGREFAYNDPQAGPRLGRGRGQRPERRAAREGPAAGGPGADARRTRPDPVKVGETLTYTLTVQQLRPVRCVRGDRHRHAAAERLRSCLRRRARAPAGGGRARSPATSAYVADGASATITIEVTPTVAGTIVNQASVDGNQGDDTPANNSDTENTAVSGHGRVSAAEGRHAAAGLARAGVQASARRRTARTARRSRSRPAVPPAQSSGR